MLEFVGNTITFTGKLTNKWKIISKQFPDCAILNSCCRTHTLIHTHTFSHAQRDYGLKWIGVETFSHLQWKSFCQFTHHFNRISLSINFVTFDCHLSMCHPSISTFFFPSLDFSTSIFEFYSHLFQSLVLSYLFLFQNGCLLYWCNFALNLQNRIHILWYVVVNATLFVWVIYTLSEKILSDEWNRTDFLHLGNKF